jgi:polysaccharide export outer membrane protein
MLRPGDVLRITVWRNAEMSGDFAVLGNGTLAHPLYSALRVAGMPLEAVEDSLRVFLRRFESSPAFVVEPLYRITVGGEVRSPSVYELPPSTTVAEAVATAGGVTERGKLDAVRLHRGGQIMLVDLTDPTPGATASSPIRSGDQLFVERRVSIFREYIAPAGAITAALAAIANILIN